MCSVGAAAAPFPLATGEGFVGIGISMVQYRRLRYCTTENRPQRTPPPVRHCLSVEKIQGALLIFLFVYLAKALALLKD